MENRQDKQKKSNWEFFFHNMPQIVEIIEGQLHLSMKPQEVISNFGLLRDKPTWELVPPTDG